MDWTYNPGGPGNPPNPANYPPDERTASGYSYEIPPGYPPPAFACNFAPPQGYFPNIPPPAFPPTVPNLNWNPPKTELRTPSEVFPQVPVDEKALQRKQDEQWLSVFLQGISGQSKEARTPPSKSHRDFGAALRAAGGLASRLSESCQKMANMLSEDAEAWSASHDDALRLKMELQEKLDVLSSSLEAQKSHVSRVRRRRRNGARRGELLLAEREAKRAEKEDAVDKWRLRQIHRVEEEKKERELKMAADSVLCEVRKKQSDIKRTQDVLRSLEKLRRLRKDAAARRGIVAEEGGDAQFQSRLDAMRRLAKARTLIYAAEEKALTVMLDGVQEEERRALKKERERRQKHKMDAVLFGDEADVDAALKPFAEYYAQAESSLHALVHVRRQWDVFLVPDECPDGSAIPTRWVVPEPPSGPGWPDSLVDS
ncbi:programmed cell death protein 7-like isoform X1 [Stigmatopora argus]